MSSASAQGLRHDWPMESKSELEGMTAKPPHLSKHDAFGEPTWTRTYKCTILDRERNPRVGAGGLVGG